MFSLKQDERKAFEDYLLADGDPARQAKAIDGLVKGSLHYDYLMLLDKLKRIETADELTAQEKALIERLIDQFERGRISGEDYSLVDQLRFKYALLRFDAADKSQDEAKRKEAIQQLLEKYLTDISFYHQKPVKEGHKEDDSLSSQDEEKSKADTLNESIFDPKSNRSNLEWYLSQSQKKVVEAKEKIAKNKGSKELEYQLRDAIEEYKRACREIANHLNGSVYLFEQSDAFQTSFDFTKYEPLGVYLFACELASSQSKWLLSQMRNESFFAQFVAYSKEFAEERVREAEKAELRHIPKDFWEHGSRLLDSLTLSQLDKLKAMNTDFFTADEQFCAAYFKKQFGEELSQETQSLWTVEEKLAVLRRLEEYARTQNLPKMLKMEFRNEILVLGPEIGHYDEALFIQYLEENDKTVSIFKDHTRNNEVQNKVRVNISRSKVQQYINSYKPLLETQTPLVTKYLRHFCIAAGGSLKKFDKYFEKHVLTPIEQEVRILQAKDGLASLKDFDISLDLFRSVAERVVLEFTESNKKVFQVDEQVTLEVSLKNIQQLYVRVFEFNTETYYKKNLAKFDTNVNLDGLEARIKEVREYTHAANIQFTDTFTFEHLKDKTGIFIIEMMGNGMSARAVIKKGSLSLVHRSTIAGQQLFILDDQKRICKGGDCRTGVIIDGKFYGASKEKGRIDIPFAKSAHQTKIILIRDQFAEIQDFQRETERFEFGAAFYLNQESMLVGSSTSILIRPKLLINGSKANLKMLKNCKAVLRITNYIDDIPVTKNFDQLSFTNDREVAVQFQVPPNLGSIHIRLTAQVQNSTTRKMQDFAAESTFDIVSMQSNPNVADAYLRREKGVYNAYFLGRNGEPFAKQEVDVTLRHVLHKGDLSTKLVTNKEGALHLGKLSGVPSIRLSMPAHRVNTRWALSAQETKHNAQYVHPGHITLLEGESLVLPISLPDGVNSPSRDLITLVRSLNDSVIEDCFESIKIELIGDAESGYHQLRADNMQQGKYFLSILTGYMRKVISLEVKKGQYWEESDGFILMKDRLQTSQDAAKILQIAGVKLQAGQQGKHTVTVDIDNATKQVRVHAIATTFVQNDGGQLASKLNDMLQWSEFSSQFLFKNQESIFMSNKKVSDEIRYVFERKQLEGKLGNTLERPTLLIKKTFIKETSIDTENLALGDQFDGKAFNDIRHHLAQALGKEAVTGNHIHGGRFTESSELINFLKNAPIQQFNLAPESQGDEDDSRTRRTITFDLALSNYSQLYLVAVDRDSLVQRNIDLDLNANVTKRDLRLNKVLDDQKGITETRKTVKLAPKVSELVDQQFPSSDFIEDITSSEVQLVDSISKVVEILEEIQKMNGLGHQQQEWDKFSFVKQWATLNANDKDRYYSEYMCHEFNLYLRRRDPEYFDAVVKPFLQYKMEKQFIDHYLLSNFRECNRYVDFALYNQLNALEICLLVDSLVQSGEMSKATCIVSALNQQMESINASTPEKVTLRNKIFDLVLNLNTLNDVKGDLAKLQDRAKLRLEEEIKQATIQLSARMQSDQSSDQSGSDEEQLELYNRSSSINDDYDDARLFRGAARNRNVQTRTAPAPKRMQMKREKQSEKKESMRRYSYDDEDDYAENERIRQVAMTKQEFEEVEQTSEFMETHYYKQINLDGSKHLIPMSQFWADYANYLLVPVGKRGAFLSDNFVDCSVSKQQVFLIQVVLDLPLAPGANHRFEPDEQRGVTVHAASHLLLYKKFIAEADLDLRRDVKVIHRYQQLNGGNESEQLSGRPNPFLSSTPYKCEVVLTNVSPKTKAFSLLYQIPQGAMPMFKSKYMKSHYMSLSPYTTQKVTFEFYFPVPGQYTHFPSNISVDQIVQARGDANILVVEKSRRITQIESFVDLLLTGTKADVLKFLENEVLIGSDKKFAAHDMLYLLKDKDFFNSAIQILGNRKYFDRQIWSYAFYHKESTKAMREYLQFRDQDLSHRIGTHFTSKLLTISDKNSGLGFTRHLEYHPMVNRRAHKIGGEGSNRILNREFRQTYDSFLTTLAQKPELTDADRLCFVYFLQLQDREQEASRLFKQIKEPQDGQLKIQYDYLQAYLEFFNRDEKDFLKARAIVRKYDEFPVTQWRMMFLAIEDQLNEIDGEFDDEDLDHDEESKDFETKIAEKRKENKKKSQKREPNLNSVEVDQNGTLKIETVNIREVTVKYYNINAELMFTRAPFIKDNTEAFTYVMPFFTERKQMVPADADDSQMNAIVTAEIPMPNKLKNLNLVIEINGGEKQQFKTFYSNQLKITTLESYGELKVSHAVTGKALPKVYVKVFGLHKSTGKEFFFRDGYTDIRGKIEYAQTSGDKLRNVKRFAILVVSDEYGSKILECDPPKTDFGPEQPIVVQAQAAQVFKPQAYAYGNEQSKMSRLLNRQNYVQSKKCK